MVYWLCFRFTEALPFSNGMKIFINTGGKGTRLHPLTYNIPKPMVPVGGKPVLAHLVDWGKQNGANEFVFLNGHLHRMIEDYFKNGEKFGVKIVHSNEPKPLGSGGPIKYAEKHIDGPFALINGDSICRVDLKKMTEVHNKAVKAGAIMTVFLHESDHARDSDVLKIDENNRVIKFISKHDDHTDAGNLTNAGLAIIEPRVLKYADKENFTFETYLYPKLLKAGEFIYGYVSNDYLKDMGTIERLKKVESYLLSESAKTKAVFLDRDGVINESVEFLCEEKDLKFSQSALDGLKQLSKTDYLLIIVTNQPAIARGVCAEEEYKKFEKYYLERLREDGIRIDDVFYCPHHPTAGKGEYKTECDCRKPKPGLLAKANEKYNIDFSKSFIIGDSRSDIKAGAAAGCKTILVQTGNAGQGGNTELDVKSDYVAKDLGEAVKIILSY